MARSLTAREWQIVEQVVLGLTNSEIAARLGLSVATVKRHLHAVTIKWDCANRVQIAVRAQREFQTPMP